MKTLLSLAEEYLEDRRSRDCSRGQTYTMRWFLRTFILWLDAVGGVTEATQLSSAHVIAWQKSLQCRRRLDGLPQKADTAWSQAKAARQFCRWLAKNGHQSSKVADAFQCIPPPRSLPLRALTHEQVRAFIYRLPRDTAQDHMFVALSEFLYSTGARIGEALALNVANIDFEKRTVRLFGKGKKERVVPIGRSAIRAMENYLAAIRPMFLTDPAETAVWINTKGRRLGYCRFQQIWGRVAYDSTLPTKVTPHAFRRACATELVRAGVDLWLVKEFLGHEDFHTLRHYVLLNVEDMRRVHAECHPREATSPPRRSKRPDITPVMWLLDDERKWRRHS